VDLGCEAELEGILEIVEHGTGAERQRDVFMKRGSTGDVAEYLVERTAK
jgi:gamma-glutamyl:cysteine ligase YbdK (ATP-grasp superfamily)